jgi:hypothetical protein
MSGDKPGVKSSMKSPYPASNNLIKQTYKVWQPRIRRDLTDEDARQIAENVTGFFAILAEWSRAARPVPAKDAAVSAPTDTAEVRHDC